MATDFWVDMPVDLQNVGPAIVIIIDKSAAPGDVLVIDSDAGGEGYVVESAVSVVAVEVAGIVGEIRLEDIEPAIAVVVGNGHAHPCLLVAVFAACASSHYGDIGERSVVIVAKEDARLRIDC